MRQIKFKAWHSSQKKMYSSEQMVNDQLTLLPDGRFINVHGEKKELSIIYTTMIPLQFTGYRDTEGKEIYHKDVITAPYYPFTDNGVQNYIGVIEWIFGQWQYVLYCVNPTKRGISTGCNTGLNDEGVEDGGIVPFRVIGNIYENEEYSKLGE